MRNRSAKILTLACLLMVPFSGCVNDGGTEVPNEVHGKLYTSTGAPAANATVTLYPVNYTPGSSSAKKSADPVKISVETNAAGSYAIENVPSGQYNMVASGGNNYAFQDSVTVTGLGVSTVPADTLRVRGTVNGTVKLQPQHSPQTAIVQVLGSDYYTNVNEDGSFALTLPQGTYRLRVTSTLSTYVPLFTSIVITSGIDTELESPLEPYYSGIPVVTGLKATPDSSGRIALRWNKPKSSTIQAYLVYRDIEGDLVPSTVVYRSTMDTTLLDTIYSAAPKPGQYSITDTTVHRYTYRIRVLDYSTEVGPAFYSLSVNSVPPSKWVQAEQGWFAVNANSPGFSFLRFTSANTGYAFQTTDFYKTTDGGTTWIHKGGTFGGYVDASFPSSNTGYILFTAPATYVYKLSGVPETMTAATPSPSLNGSALYFVSNDTGFIAGAEGRIMKTVDGGTNWVNQTTEISKNLGWIRCFNGERCFASGDSGTLLKTTNGGQSWVIQNTGTTGTISKLNVISSSVIFAVAGTNTLLKTTNGGTTWTSKQFPVSLVGGVRFINSTTGFAGSGGTILSTTDGGQTWDSETVSTTTNVGDIQCTENICYATASPPYTYPPSNSVLLKRYLAP